VSTIVALKCAKCQTEMVTGFIVESTGRQLHPTVWVQGEVWQFMLYGGRSYPITCYRCPSCGYLESYAR
jgi:hypothetical protein